MRRRFSSDEVRALEQSAYEAGIAAGKTTERERTVDILGIEISSLVADGDMGSKTLVMISTLIDVLENSCINCGKPNAENDSDGGRLCNKCLDEFWNPAKEWDV